LDEPFAGLFTQGMVVHETYRTADGAWLSPEKVMLSENENIRTARRAETGEPVEIGPIEKMSKSKQNTVGPEDITATYGADTARWFMLSDSPPERDVQWTDAGVEGAHRFVQRIWRTVQAGAAIAERRADRPKPESAAATACLREAHKTLAAVTADYDGLRFNVAIARLHALLPTITSACDSAGNADAPADLRWACAQSLDMFVQMFAPIMPHLAEECWHSLAHPALVAETPWPVADAALVADEAIILPVQVNGKRRGELSVSPDASDADVEEAALALDAVRRSLAGRPPKKIIVVPGRIVNVVG
jgi:leucyl-tRNA synthetase